MFLGAFGTTATRFWDGFTNTMAPLSLGLGTVSEIDAYKAVSSMADSISTWRNGSKAIFMHQFNRLMTSKNRTISHRDFKLAEEVAQAIGFRLSEETQYYQISDIVKAKQDYQNDVTNEIVNAYWDYSKAIENHNLSPDVKEKTRQRIGLLIQSLDTNYERTQVRKAVQKILTESQDARAVKWRKIRQIWNNGQIDFLTSWHNKLTADGVLQQTSPSENQ